MLLGVAWWCGTMPARWLGRWSLGCSMSMPSLLRDWRRMKDISINFRLREPQKGKCKSLSIKETGSPFINKPEKDQDIVMPKSLYVLCFLPLYKLFFFRHTLHEACKNPTYSKVTEPAKMFFFFPYLHVCVHLLYFVDKQGPSNEVKSKNSPTLFD